MRKREDGAGAVLDCAGEQSLAPAGYVGLEEVYEVHPAEKLATLAETPRGPDNPERAQEEWPVDH